MQLNTGGNSGPGGWFVLRLESKNLQHLQRHDPDHCLNIELECGVAQGKADNPFIASPAHHIVFREKTPDRLELIDCLRIFVLSLHLDAYRPLQPRKSV